MSRSERPSSSIFFFSAADSTGRTSIPVWISPLRMRKTFRAPAEATAAKGTSLAKMFRTLGETLSRGTRALRPRATEQDAVTATPYDFARSAVVRGEDLLALELLMATLRDWLATCHPTTPNVLSPGWSIPAVTTRLDRTKEDIRKGSKTGSPVSALGLAAAVTKARQ